MAVCLPAGFEVLHAVVHLARLGLVDVAADNAVHTAFVCFLREDLFELADEGTGSLDLELDRLAQRCVGHAQPAAYDVVVAVDL